MKTLSRNENSTLTFSHFFSILKKEKDLFLEMSKDNLMKVDRAENIDFLFGRKIKGGEGGKGKCLGWGSRS